MTVKPLALDRLYRPADLSRLAFATTADLEPIDGLVGQARAAEAIDFGTRVEHPGFNLFVIGPQGARMQDAVKALLVAQAATKPRPNDWVYVNNFTDPERPIAIELPPGRARAFQQAMHELIDDLQSALPAVFQSEDYQTRRGAIDEAFQRKQAEAFAALREKAGTQDIGILRTPLGFALAPVKEGQVVPPDEFATWPEARRQAVQAAIATLEKDLEHIVHQIPKWEKQRRDEVRELNRETAKFAVDQQIDEAKADFTDIARVTRHIETVRADLVENVAMFVAKGEEGEEGVDELRPGTPFDRYEVNILVTQDGREPGVPIIEELHPTLGNLIGRIEYLSRRGVLTTNFRLVKAGALHRANGGYLLLDARAVLMEPFSWTALKRTLRRGEIAIEDISRFIGLTSTASLEPDPIPLKVKVVLFGDRLLYFLLAAYDPELGEHFKVLADFENDLARTPETEAILARLVAGIAGRNGLRPFDRDAVALVLEHAARLADHAGKLSLVVEQLREVLIEADFCARDAAREVVARSDVESALAARIRRAARIRDRAQEVILEKVALIDTAGTHVGQVNGLSVTELGGFAFGRPTRITCRVRPGSGKVVDIEREVELGGPVHSKGVLILSGFLAGHYALDTPMSLFASLVFEQSYAGVEGDSASSAELYALLSALAEAPLRQDLAVTGSVNQHGAIQAIGGVNEKIEGFFDICRARGLTGTQGVLIPEANVQHLMLRADVIAACEAGSFAIYPVATIDDGIALLSGRAAGRRATDGRYPPDSLNGQVEARLRAFASIRRDFARQGGKDTGP
ncbi:MAG: ATP-dependent protease [Bradyrhizobiaceae bacterium]|nr:MAG: ATP-dependent protease [Bradyrhizobiaceae bacterium]